jgi:hypothetical protein
VLPNCESLNSLEKSSEESNSAVKQKQLLEKIFSEFFGSSSASKAKGSPNHSDQNHVGFNSSRSNKFAASFEKF